MPLIRVGEVDLYYESEGQGPPLLLIHGTGADAGSWDPVLPFLTASNEAERRVIRYDRRGYSRSPAAPFPKKDYYRRHADDAAGLLSALGIPTANVLGWSAGGIVALGLAIHHPGVVGKVLLYEPPLWATRHLSLGMILPFLRIILNRLVGRRRQAAEAFFRMALTEADGTNGYDRLGDAEKAQLLANSDALFAELDAGTGEELTREQVAALRGPMALLIGGHSAPFLQAAAERLFAAAPSLTPLRVAEANHIFLRDHPQRFAEIAFPYI
jgi:pimeloyl-ACP methyl ester carboxylesterase